jgi:PadR family transcriptional regulator, regulatory protein PadR
MSLPGRGDLELAVLLSVARLGAEAYGAEVRRDVSRRARKNYSVGAIYATLQRLEQKRLLASWDTEPTRVRGGRSRRCFELTTAGRQALRAAAAARRRLWEGADVAWGRG